MNELVEIVDAFVKENSTGHYNIPAIILKWIIHLIASILVEIQMCESGKVSENSQSW